MNRREAIAALLALPAATTRITRAAVAPTDVIVIETEQLLAETDRDGIRRAMKYSWPHNEVVVLDGGLKLKIAETSSPPPAPPASMNPNTPVRDFGWRARRPSGKSTV